MKFYKLGDNSVETDFSSIDFTKTSENVFQTNYFAYTG